MEDFKTLTVEKLRQLARELLGKGSSRLRTRGQLLEALARLSPGTPAPAPRKAKKPASRAAAVPRPAPAARAAPAKRATAPVRKKTAAVSETPRVPVPKTVSVPPRKPPGHDEPPAAISQGRNGPLPSREEPARGTPPPAEAAASNGAPLPPRPTAVTRPPALERTGGLSPRAGERTGSHPPLRPPRRSRPVPPSIRSAASAPPTPGASPSSAPAASEPPLESAFFDAPPAPRRPRRPLPLAEVPEPPSIPLPLADVGTEAPVLLVRDPTTLFVFWDFRRELERGAALGLAEPRLLLRVFRDERLERSLELPLGTRSTYLEGLRPGEAYAAEVVLLGREGWTRPMGRRSGPRRLPPDGPSERLEVRTLRVAWSDGLAAVAQPSDTVEVTASEALDSPRRLPLPTRPGNRGGGRGPSGAPRSGRNE